MEECDHQDVERSGIIREDGYEVEWNETCTECGKEWVWSYGSLEDIENEND